MDNHTHCASTLMATILRTLNVLNQLEKSWLFQIKLHSHDDRIPNKYFQLNPGLSLALKLWDKTVVISVVPNAYKQGLCSAESSRDDFPLEMEFSSSTDVHVLGLCKTKASTVQ